MIKVIQVNGTEKHLYELVAPLVMNPKVLNYNNDYPFKTGEKFIWFIALSDEDGRKRETMDYQQLLY